MLMILEATQQAGGGMNITLMIVYVVFFLALGYFFFFAPTKKEQKKRNAIMESMEVGDVVVTTSGFYGVLIDITEEDVIVEFGSNKNCRIPMRKSAIESVEKAEK